MRQLFHTLSLAGSEAILGSFLFGLALGGFVFIFSYALIQLATRIFVSMQPRIDQTLFIVRNSSAKHYSLESAVENFAKPLAVLIAFGCLGLLSLL